MEAHHDKASPARAPPPPPPVASVASDEVPAAAVAEGGWRRPSTGSVAGGRAASVSSRASGDGGHKDGGGSEEAVGGDAHGGVPVGRGRIPRNVSAESVGSVGSAGGVVGGGGVAGGGGGGGGRAHEGGEHRLPSSRQHLGLHVLVAEREPVVRKTGRSFLRKLGCTHEEAEDCTRVLDLHPARRAAEASRQFDVVLLDTELGGVGAVEVCRRLRKAGVDVPVIAMSIRCTSTDLDYFREVGFDAVLRKPFRLNRFRDALVLGRTPMGKIVLL